MPFKPSMKRGQKRKIVLEFSARTDKALERLGKAVRALAKKHRLRLKKQGRR